MGLIDAIFVILLIVVYAFFAFAVALAMLIDEAPPIISVTGKEPKPVGKLGATLHGIFWPIVVIINKLRNIL